MNKIKTQKKPYTLLRSKMVEGGIDQENLGKLLGINQYTMNKKLNKKIEFTRKDILRIMRYFRLTPKETVNIFFVE